MSLSTMAALHAAEKGREADAVFAVLKDANSAIARFGRDKVVNASIGAIYDENEKFVVLPSVLEYYHQMPAEELMNYAPIAGIPDFLEGAIEFTFRGFKPENTYIKAVATPGGTGAVRHVFFNYLEQGQKVLIPDWFWGNYKTIALEHFRSIETYQMFNEQYEFSLNDVQKKTGELLKIQDNLVIVFNTPAHNPTGHSMTIQEWADMLEFLKDCARDTKKKITVLVDMAYIDYAGDADVSRTFMKLFCGLPENILITMAFSMSKAFTMYGMRSGALIGISSSPEVAEEFSRINSASNRGVWSNGTRGAQKFLADVMKNPAMMSRIDSEREYYSLLMKRRANIFLEEAKQVGLQVLPYHTGFFITVPAENPQAVTQKLVRDNIYALHLKKGIRFAICAIPLNKMPGIADKTKAAMK